MRWIPKQRPTDWHRWFAWFPVEVDGVKHWLEYVYRLEEHSMVGSFYRYRGFLVRGESERGESERNHMGGIRQPVRAEEKK